MLDRQTGSETQRAATGHTCWDDGRRNPPPRTHSRHPGRCFAIRHGHGGHVHPPNRPARSLFADDTDAGTASCGGYPVDVKALVCGDGFSQGSCVAQWVNGGGENEWYFFMGIYNDFDIFMGHV